MKSFRILVLQDNQDLLKLIVKYLELCGWRATAANTAENFWDQLGRERPNLILADLRIQGCEAFSLLHALKLDPRYSDIPVIAMTGVSSMTDKNRCIAAGCDKILAKPFHLDELLRLVEGFAKNYKNDHETRRTTMKKPRRHFAAVALLALALTGCQAMTGRTAGQNVDDARISTAVQTTLTADKASNFTPLMWIPQTASFI